MPPLTVRRLLDAELSTKALRLQELARKLQRGDISIADWRAEMARQIKYLHIIQYAVGKCGFHQLDVGDYEEIESVVKHQLGYLNRFATLISHRPELIATAGFVQRVGLYAQAGRVTYETAAKAERIAEGATWAMRVLHSAEHCAGCAGAAGVWVPAPEIVPIGGYECTIFCKCTIIYAYTHNKPHLNARQAMAAQARRGSGIGAPAGTST